MHLVVKEPDNPSPAISNILDIADSIDSVNISYQRTSLSDAMMLPINFFRCHDWDRNLVTR